MKYRTLFTATLVALGAVGATAAAQSGSGEHRPARAQLDVNGDGVIDRAEAAAHPRLAQHFDRLDRNGDGRLDAGERPRRHGKGHGTGPGPGHGHGPGHGGPGHHGAIATLDVDGDGRISRAELAAATADHAGSRGGAHWLEQHFEAIDANHDGYIVRSELRAWHQAQAPQRRAKMAQRFEERFAAADLNGDGKLSRVEVEEKMPHLTPRFAWMDENGDGFLSREELRPQPPR